jgi:hypothetical protein
MKEVEIDAVGGKLKVFLRESEYSNGRKAIVAIDAECGQPWGMLTVNVVEAVLLPDEMIVKTYSENEGWALQIVELFPELFESAGWDATVGRVSCPVYRFKGEVE